MGEDLAITGKALRIPLGVSQFSTVLSKSVISRRTEIALDVVR
jgi:hypothetical protein